MVMIFFCSIDDHRLALYQINLQRHTKSGNYGKKVQLDTHNKAVCRRRNEMMPSVRYCPWCGTANQSALPRCLACGFFFQSRSSSGRDEEQPLKQMRLTKAFPYQEREAANAFQREAVLLAQLDHIHLPKIYDYFSERGCCYLVMEFIAGTTLEAYLDAIPGRRL